MEKETTENRSKIVLAVILITLGVLWLLGQINQQYHLGELFQPFYHIFSRIGRVIFSWPMILILVGLVLIAGKRSGGWILIVVGSLFLLPRIFMFPHFSFSMIFPLILILAGGVLITKRF